MCIHVPFIHTCTTTYKKKIYLVGLPSVLYERPGQNERSVLNKVFLLFFRCFSVLFMKSAPLFIQKVPLFMKTNKTMSICVYTCTIYTYMHHIHHQIPPEYKIYLVGLPSVLYKTPGQIKRSVLNQLFLLFFSAFHRKCWFHTKSVTFHDNQQNQVDMYVYMYHLYIHAPPHTHTKKIYLVGLPSVLYERLGQNERSVLDKVFLLFFRCFSVLFMNFS